MTFIRNWWPVPFVLLMYAAVYVLLFGPTVSLASLTYGNAQLSLDLSGFVFCGILGMVILRNRRSYGMFVLMFALISGVFAAISYFANTYSFYRWF